MTAIPAIHPLALVSYQPMRSPTLGRPVHEQRPTIIGLRPRIGAFAVVYAGAEIGDDCLIGEHAVIREGCKIGDRCLIGSGVFMNYEAHIEDEVRIIQGAHIAGMCRIGSGTFIAPGVVMANVRHIDIDHQVFIPSESSAPIIGERVMIGTGAILVAGIRIGDRAVIASGAVVCKDVPAGGFVRGEPARSPEARKAMDLDRQLDAAETMIAAQAVAPRDARESNPAEFFRARM